VLQTGGNLDMSITGQGFFQITMPDGTLAYTRDGSFSMDNQGNVVTASGYPLSPAITIPDHRAVGHHRRRRHRLGDHGRQFQGDDGRADTAGEFHQRRRAAAHRQQPAGRIGGQRRAAGRHAGTNGLGS
jgi:flagellar hook-basal body protein